MAQRIPTAVRLAGVNIGLTGVTFLTGIVLARALAPDGRGELAMVTLWALAISQIALWGSHHFLARRAALEPDQVGAIYSFGGRLALFLLLAIGAFCLAITPTGVLEGLPIAPALLIAGMLIIPASTANTFQTFIELGRQNYFNYNFCRAAFAVLFFAGSIALFTTGFRDVLSYLLVFVGAAYFAPILGAFVIRRSISKASGASKLSIPYVFGASSGFATTILFQVVATQGDKLLLSALFPAAALGVFVVASSVAQVQHTLGEAFSQLFYSRLVSVRKVDEIDREWTSSKLRQIVLVSALILAVCIAILPPLVPIVYGAAFSPASALLFVLLPAVTINVIARPYDKLFKALGQPALATKMVLVNTAVMTAGVVAAYFMQSLTGVAFAVLAGFVAGLATGSFIAFKDFGLNPAQCLIPRPKDFVAIAGQVKGIFIARSQPLD